MALAAEAPSAVVEAALFDGILSGLAALTDDQHRACVGASIDAAQIALHFGWKDLPAYGKVRAAACEEHEAVGKQVRGCAACFECWTLFSRGYHAWIVEHS